MVRDLFLGSVLGGSLLIWRWWGNRKTSAATPSRLSQSPAVEDLKQELAIAQQKLTQAQQALDAETEKRIAVERELAEANQLSGDRVVQLAELIAENVDLKAQLAQLDQPRRRKKRAAKLPVEENAPVEQTAVAIAEPITPEIFELDLSLIQQKQAETQTATELLQPIFTEDEPSINSPSLGALDAAHSAFLQILSRQDSWTRDALETEAQANGLLLDGALEIINEAAFEACDEPLLEGDDPIEVNATVLKEFVS
jgi:flagellar biosynthesis/type III secretory pathway chaperone